MPGLSSPHAPSPRRRVLRVAHLTDIHVQPERGAAEGMATALHHAQSLADPPDLILNGGDIVGDCLAADAPRARVQWDLCRRVLRDACSTPIVHCIGNHDVWGWGAVGKGLTGDEPLFGHGWAMDALGLDTRYHAFERAGWKFIVLDSTFRTPQDYTARLDDEQFAWLGAQLAATPPAQPVLVLSHIPILCACAFLDGPNEASGDWRVPGAWMHIDARRIKGLFAQHPNVRLCLSGHIHLVDRVDYLGVTYLCNGAVCGGWWKGPCQEFEPGYGLIDLYDDGSFDHDYIAYGWQPRG